MDDQGFTEWAAGVERQLLRSAYLLAGDLHRAQDLVQEALVKVALRWARLSGGNPTAYARTIIVRDNVSLWRRHRREVWTAESSDLAAVSTDPEAAMVVRRALDRLTPRQRAVLVLRHFDDLTERETADVLGVSIGTVKSQKRRGARPAPRRRPRTSRPDREVPMNEPDLHQVLERATDALEARGLATNALAEARHRRKRGRGAAVTAAAAVAVVAIVVGVRMVGSDDSVSPAPAPAPAPSGPSGGVVAPSDVRDPLTFPRNLPEDESLSLPAELTPRGQVPDGAGGSVIAAVQTTDGAIGMVTSGATWRQLTEASGTLFRHSLTLDGGAIALRAETQFAIYSMYADRAFTYPVQMPGESGLWLNDGVAFAYDVPGPGGESREHEHSFSTDSVAFPVGDDMDAIDIAGDGTLHEFTDGHYFRWTNFQDRGARLDMSHLGGLRGPVAGYRDAEVVAVVRSGLDSAEEIDADGVLVLDTEGKPLALLPVEGVSIDEVQLHLWVDESRLLFEVGNDLVLWNTRTDERTHVATIPDGASVALSDGDGSLVRR